LGCCRLITLEGPTFDLGGEVVQRALTFLLSIGIWEKEEGGKSPTAIMVN
jgi:hypothetical protein